MTDLRSPVVDVHAHYYDADYVARLRAAGRPALLADDPLGGPDGLPQRFAMLDAAGIDVQLVSAGPLFPDFPDERTATDAAADHNDRISALADATGGRLRGLGLLPLPHTAAAVAEVGRAANHGLLGWSIGATIAGAPISQPDFFPLFEALDAQRALLLVHPVGNATGFYRSALDLSWLLGAPVEDTAVAIDLAVSGWLDRFPRIRVLIPHLGGVLPFISQRIDDQYLRRNSPETAAPSSRIRSLLVDSVNSDPDSLAQAIRVLGLDRVLLGTDFPFLPGDMFTTAVRYLDDPRLAPGTGETIRRTNPSALGVLGQNRQEHP
jgi:predicted TIM-barrel fold metal-dependent hydrolase